MSLHWMTIRGFDFPRLKYGVRTAVACCVAMILAWALGLEHPQWAGMSVWAASQPLRGQLFEKGLFRVSGTVIGCVVGVLLVFAMQIHPALLIIGLALWIAACTWLGNLQRGYVAYGTVLAGYSASMVALLDTSHPDRVLQLGADRLGTVLTGVVVATLVGYFLSGDGDATGLHHRIKALLADVLRHLGHPARATDPGHPLLARLAAIEEELDGQGVGSVRSRRTVRATRSLLIATVPLILRSEGRNLMQADLSEHLLSTAEDMTGPDSHSTSQQLARLVTNTSVPQLKTDLDGLQTAFANWIGQQEKAATDPPGPQAPPVILHRDWIGAREAAVRAGGAMLVFGFLWQVTGWDLGAYMLLGLSVMISLFSTFENPPHIMRFIITGQVIGVAAALVCRWLVWPFAESELEQIVMLFPFVMLAPLLLSHARTMIASTDYSMVLLLLSQPGMPLTGDFTGSLLMGFAVLSAPLVALVGYLLIYPISLQRRQNHLIAMMMTDLAAIARNDLALKHRQVWQARFYHRSLRLVRISEKLARAEDRALNSCIAVLALARMAMICHELLQGTDSSNPVRRAARQVLARLQRISRDRQHLVTALEQLAVRLPANEATIIPIAIKALKRSL